MSREWSATCKDCGSEFGYSHASLQADRQRGLSRMERCVACRKRHGREIGTMGMSHYTPPLARPLIAPLVTGGLGAVEHPERLHVPVERSSRLSEFRPNFGITDADVIDLIRVFDDKQVAVIEAPTGSGKSSFLPYRLMMPPDSISKGHFTNRGQILITQPRVAATTTLPTFVARDLHGSTLGPGFDIGYRHSKDRSTDRRNKLLYATDGSLINWIVGDRLADFSLIMIDEAHERSINIDLILGLLKARLSRHPDLRLLIASATIDAKLFVNYFGGPSRVGHLQFRGREGADFGYEGPHYSVDTPLPTRSWPREMGSRAVDAVAGLLVRQAAGEEVSGDILCFLHSIRKIEDSCDILRERLKRDGGKSGVDVYPLYASVGAAGQSRAIAPSKKGRTKVVFATNVAETSLTIKGIVHVVDSGLISQSGWDPVRLIKTVEPRIHSQAGCKQRWGRAGRVARGIVHCLYTKQQFDAFPPHTIPEIRRAPLEAVVLAAHAAGVEDIESFDWIEAPAALELSRARQALAARGAIDEDGDITAHGLELNRFAADTDHANLMVLADRLACAVEMATLLAMGEVGLKHLLQWNRDWDAHTRLDALERHDALRAHCQDDLELLLALWAAWEHHNAAGTAEPWCTAACLREQAFRAEVAPARERLLSPLEGRKKDSSRRPVSLRLVDRVRMVLAYGMPDRVYVRGPSGAYQRVHVDGRPGTVDEAVTIGPLSVLHGYEPNAFVCIDRHRRLDRTSPLAEPTVVVEGSILAFIAPDWREHVGLGVVALARRARAVSRSPTGELREAHSERLQPIVEGVLPESEWRVLNAESKRVRLTAPWLTPSPPLDEVCALAAEPVLEEEAFLLDASVDLVQDAADSDEREPSTVEAPAGQRSFAVRVERSGLRAGDVLRVKRVEVTAPGHGVVVPGCEGDNDAFDRFAKRFKVGAPCRVEAVGTRSCPMDNSSLLLVREPKTGLVVPLARSQLDVAGIDHVVRWLGGKGMIELQVVAIDRRCRKVDLRRLAASGEACSKVLGNERRKVVSIEVVEIWTDSIWVTVVGTDPPVYARCYADRLPKAVTASSLGAKGRAQVSRRKHARVKLPRVPKNLRDLIGRGTLKGVRLEGKFLTVSRVLIADDLRLLRGCFRTAGPRAIIDNLFALSTGLSGTLIDLEAVTRLEEARAAGGTVKARVVGMIKHGIFVKTDSGVEGYLPRTSTWTGDDIPSEIDDELELAVESVQVDEGSVRFSRKLPDLDPLTRYPEGSEATGRVESVEDKHANVRLDEHAVGFLPIGEIGTEYLNRVSDVIGVGDEVHVRVLSVQRDRYRTSIRLSMMRNILGCSEPEFENLLGCDEPDYANELGCS